jgi:hypothetical protein
MKQRYVILRLLLPANQNSPVAIPPAVRPLDHPTPGLEARFLFDLLRLFAAYAEVSRVVELPDPFGPEIRIA